MYSQGVRLDGGIIIGLIADIILSGVIANLTNILSTNAFLLISLIVIEFVLVFVIGSMIDRLPVRLGAVLLIFYSALTGVTVSGIFQLFTPESTASTFLVTACALGLMSLFGFITNTDLTRAGNILLMVLTGLILASIINIFLNSSVLSWTTTIFGVIVFAGLTAYDTQKIIDNYRNHGFETERHAVVSVLMLYLDFINLFLSFIRFFGKRRKSN